MLWSQAKYADVILDGASQECLAGLIRVLINQSLIRSGQ